MLIGSDAFRVEVGVLQGYLGPNGACKRSMGLVLMHTRCRNRFLAAISSGLQSA